MMNNGLLRKARQVFSHTYVYVEDFCSVDSCNCRHCYRECSLRVAGIYSRFSNRLIGWFEPNGRVIKTNPNPSIRYRKRILGEKKERKRGKRKHWIQRAKEKL